jgi:hypothetical protein
MGSAPAPLPLPDRRRVVRLAVALALVVGVLAVVVVRSGAPSGTGVTPAPSVDRPLLDVQEYRDAARGFSVNVPQTWTKKTATSYVDFVDPADPSRRYLRINTENAGGDARQFMQVVERNLSAPSHCLAPYQTIALRDVELAGRPAAELEYTCGQGDKMRHGVWRAVVSNGRAYHFFLTVPDSRFADSKVIYDEMVRTFQLGA